MKQKFKRVCGFAKLPALVGISVATLASPVLFAGADTGNAFRNASRAPGTLDSSTSAARTSMRVTPDGTEAVHNVESKVAPGATHSGKSQGIRPSGNTVWIVDDENAIADGVAIDSNNVWGAWTLSGARLSVYPINGNGTEAWHFSSFNSGNSGVAAAKAADRLGFIESNAPGTDFRQHGFTSNSNGIPDWSFPYPVSDPNLPANSRKVATSRDGSTIAGVVSDSVT